MHLRVQNKFSSINTSVNENYSSNVQTCCYSTLVTTMSGSKIAAQALLAALTKLEYRHGILQQQYLELQEEKNDLAAKNESLLLLFQSNVDVDDPKKKKASNTRYHKKKIKKKIKNKIKNKESNTDTVKNSIQTTPLCPRSANKPPLPPKKQKKPIDGSINKSATLAVMFKGQVKQPLQSKENKNVPSPIHPIQVKPKPMTKTVMFKGQVKQPLQSKENRTVSSPIRPIQVKPKPITKAIPSTPPQKKSRVQRVHGSFKPRQRRESSQLKVDLQNFKTFVQEKPFDRNGILYYLATHKTGKNGKLRKYRNPHNSGDVECIPSSVFSGNGSAAGRFVEHCHKRKIRNCTNDTCNSNFKIDFKSKKVKIDSCRFFLDLLFSLTLVQ